MIPVEIRMNGGQLCRCGCHTDFSWLTFDEQNPLFNFANIDGLFLVERARHFLVVEWKWPGQSFVPGSGHFRSLQALARLPNFRVVIVHGPKGEPMQIQQVFAWGAGPIELTNREDFQRRMRQWYQRASASFMNGNGAP